MCKDDIVRIQIDAMMLLFTSMSGITMDEMMQALKSVYDEVDIPPRGPKGSDHNVRRVNVFTNALIERLEQIKRERG